MISCPVCRLRQPRDSGQRVFIEATCPVCLQLESPFVTLPCRHGLCDSCLERLGGRLEVLAPGEMRRRSRSRSPHRRAAPVIALRAPPVALPPWDEVLDDAIHQNAAWANVDEAWEAHGEFPHDFWLDEMVEQIEVAEHEAVDDLWEAQEFALEMARAEEEVAAQMVAREALEAEDWAAHMMDLMAAQDDDALNALRDEDEAADLAEQFLAGEVAVAPEDLFFNPGDAEDDWAAQIAFEEAVDLDALAAVDTAPDAASPPFGPEIVGQVIDVTYLEPLATYRVKVTGFDQRKSWHHVDSDGYSTMTDEYGEDTFQDIIDLNDYYLKGQVEFVGGLGSVWRMRRP